LGFYFEFVEFTPVLVPAIFPGTGSSQDWTPGNGIGREFMHHTQAGRDR
jgi:hypothetical protein